MSFNKRMEALIESNYKTKPVNVSLFSNPFLLMDSTKALNIIATESKTSTRADSKVGVDRPATEGDNINTNPAPAATEPPVADMNLDEDAGPPITTIPDEPDAPDETIVDGSVPGGDGDTVPISDETEGAWRGVTRSVTPSGKRVMQGVGLTIIGNRVRGQQRIIPEIGLTEALSYSMAYFQGKHEYLVKKITYDPATDIWQFGYGNLDMNGKYEKRQRIENVIPTPHQSDGPNYLNDFIVGVGGRGNALYNMDRLGIGDNQGGN